MRPGEPLAQHAEALVRAFVRPDRRARLLELLGTSKGRAKLRAALAHFADLDPRFARPLVPSKHHAHDIETILRERGAPDTCYILSESPDLDGHVMPLNSALQQIVGGGMGSFISCIPGTLGYFESEEAGERYILQRTA
jgi:hypothetical protein